MKEIFRASAELAKAVQGFNLWRLHPSAIERLTTLEQPSRLFRLSWALPFFVGLLLSFILASEIQAGFASFLSLQEPLRSLRDASVGAVYWPARGAWLLLFLSFIAMILAPIAWLVSGVLEAQIQKQVALELAENQRGLAQYLRLAIPALWLALGMEIGIWLVPFNILAANSLASLVASFLLLIVMTCLAWWFLAYIRFATIRLFARHIGTKVPIWRIRLIEIASSCWLFLFFVPGFVLGRLLITSESRANLNLVAGAFLGWLAVTVILSPIVLAASWGMIKILSSLRPARCPAWGQITRHTNPAIEVCEHCGHSLGEWLFERGA